jgi:hypothetical protein
MTTWKGGVGKITFQRRLEPFCLTGAPASTCDEKIAKPPCDEYMSQCGKLLIFGKCEHPSQIRKLKPRRICKAQRASKSAAEHGINCSQRFWLTRRVHA